MLRSSYGFYNDMRLEKALVIKDDRYVKALLLTSVFFVFS